MSTTNATFVKIGDRFPAVTLQTLDGESLDLQSLFGKKFILFMWASW